MNFFTIQNIGKYTKTMEMQMKWNKRKTTGDFTADGSTKLMDPTARQAEEIRLAQADGSARLSTQIRTKLANGKKLTQEEMDYLQKHDPQTYQKAKALEEERKSYERDLEKCKTKEDVQRVKMNRTVAALSVVNSVKSNPAIPEGAKLGIIWQELQKNMAMEEAINEFVKSGRYAQLPTEAEKAKAEEELKKAEEAERGIEDPAEDTEKVEVEETEGTEQKKNDDAEKILKEQASLELTKKSIKNEQAMTRQEAESTPEAMKVKRAKVQAAYKENQPEPITIGQTLDVKAGEESMKN